MRKLEPEDRLIMKQTYVKKIINVVRTKGFLSLTIQELAQLMNMSRASLYNYFSSKEDIIKEVSDYYIAYTQEAEQTIEDDALSYPWRLQKVYEQTVLSAIYASDIFLNDLKASCPTLYEKTMKARKERLAVIHTFYERGMKEGVFHINNPAILIMQDEAVLRNLLYSSFLMEEGLSLKQALYDYYEAKKYQMFKPDFINSQHHETIHEVVERITQKLAEN